MFQTIVTILDWLGIVVFAVTGALVASRKQMDIVGFAMMGTVTGIGGGTLRDLLLGLPVFWIRDPTFLIICVLVSCVVFFTAHIPQSRQRFLLWCDAIGLALFAVTGAEKALQAGIGPVVAVVMGAVTATFGGIIRDVLGNESPMILSREIYILAALAGAAAFVGLTGLNTPREMALGAGFAVAFGIRAAALIGGWSPPRYRPRS